MQSYKDPDFSLILKQWDIQYKTSHPEYPISGSPQRSSYRIVVETNDEDFFVLEKIKNNTIQQKQRIAQTLITLKKHQIPYIYPPLQNSKNQFLSKKDESYWQLTPFIQGMPLDRPGYVTDQWRGKQTAEFLITLRKNTKSILTRLPLPKFSLKDYVLNMVHTMKQVHPKQYQQINPIIHYLNSDFFKKFETFPTCFCHGDYHPLNIIWGTHSIKAVIDWEFFGQKIETYDLANMLGCLGIEEPSSLQKGFACSFLKTIKEHHLISKTSYSYLLDCVIALRFAWLAEWLRSNDKDMIELELDYLYLLHEHKKTIKQTWNHL